MRKQYNNCNVYWDTLYNKTYERGSGRKKNNEHAIKKTYKLSDEALHTDNIIFEYNKIRVEICLEHS